MQKVARRLHGLGCEVLVAAWADAPPKGDAADCPPDQYAGIIGDAEPWEPEPVEDGARLLDDVADFLARYVAFPSLEARHAAALWAAHAHALNCFDSTPRLALLSAEKQSGKTRTLEVLELVVPTARHTSSLTAAALFRLVEKEQSVLLIDEADTLFGSRAGDHEELRGLLNAGHRRGAVAYRCVGDRGQEVKAFPAYAAVAIAGLGELPDTILDRAVLLRMRRRAPDETVVDFRYRDAHVAGSRLQERLSKWVEQNEEALSNARPAMPEGITDRPADVWEPLLAIADVAGGDWPSKSRTAAKKLNDDRQAADPSLGVRLLADIRSAFDVVIIADGLAMIAGQRDRLSTADLIEKLVALEESPWGDLRGKPLDSRGLARRLKPFSIKPKVIRIEEATPRGYERADFLDAWSRYLPATEPNKPPPPPSGNSATGATAQHPSSEGVADEGRCCASDPQQPGQPQQDSEFQVADVGDVADFPERVAPNPNGRRRGRRPAAPELMAQVRAAFEEAGNYAAAARLLTERGIPTSQGGQWAPRTVRYMLVDATIKAAVDDDTAYRHPGDIDPCPSCGKQEGYDEIDGLRTCAECNHRWAVP